MKAGEIVPKLVILIAVITTFFGTCVIAAAATYYLDATNGNDSNSGTSELSPWKTIKKVNASTFVPGDQILFKRGCVWREQLLTPNGGTTGYPITFGSYGFGNRPVITGLDLVSGSSWTLDYGNIWKAVVSTEPKLAVFDSALGINVASKAALDADNKWWWSANAFYTYSSTNPGTKYVTPGVQVGARGNAIHVTKNYITLDGLELQGANTRWMGNVHMEYDGVHDFVMQNCESKWGANGFAIGPKNGGGNTVRDCLIHHNMVHGISSDTDTGPSISRQNTIQRNVIYSNGSNGIVIDANYWIIEHNIVHDNGTNTSEDIGIHLYTATADSGSGDYNIIRYNIVYNQKGSANDGAGIAIDQWCDNNQVYYNICYNNDGPGFYNYDAAGNAFYNNAAYGNCQNSSGGLTMKGEFRLTGARTTNTTLKNNIGYAISPSAYAIYLNPDTSQSSFTITNNLWFSTNADWYYFNVTGGNIPGTWNSLTGGTDLNGDPMFVSPGTDFQLKSASPCINAGLQVGLSQDFQGNPFYGAVDIGAYEFKGRLSPPPNLKVTNHEEGLSSALKPEHRP